MSQFKIPARIFAELLNNYSSVLYITSHSEVEVFWKGTSFTYLYTPGPGFKVHWLPPPSAISGLNFISIFNRVTELLASYLQDPPPNSSGR